MTDPKANSGRLSQAVRRDCSTVRGSSSTCPSHHTASAANIGLTTSMPSRRTRTPSRTRFRGTVTISSYSTARTKCRLTTSVYISNWRRGCTTYPTLWRPAGTPPSCVHCLSTSSPGRKWSWSSQSALTTPYGTRSSLLYRHVSRGRPSTWVVSLPFLFSSFFLRSSESSISSEPWSDFTALLFYGYRWPAREGWEGNKTVTSDVGNGRRYSDSVTTDVVGDLLVSCGEFMLHGSVWLYRVSVVWLWKIVPCNLVIVDETLSFSIFILSSITTEKPPTLDFSRTQL